MWLYPTRQDKLAEKRGLPANGAPHLQAKPVKAVPVHASTSRAARGGRSRRVVGSHDREGGSRGNVGSRSGARGNSSWPGSRGAEQGGSVVERGEGRMRAVNRGGAGRNAGVVMPTNMRITIFNELVSLSRRCLFLILAWCVP